MTLKLGLFSPRQRPIPYVQQMQWTDCGAACLAMVLGYHGRKVSLTELRDAIGIARDGVSARDILEAAEPYGLSGRGVQVDVDELELLPRGAILHWEFNHFIVFDGLSREGVRLLDPAYGAQELSFDRFSRSFTGVALILEPTESFEAGGTRGQSHLHRLFCEVMAERSVFGRVVAMSLLLRLFALAVPLLTGLVVDRVVPRVDTHLLWVAFFGVAFLLVFNALASVLRAALLLHLRTKLDTRMTVGFLSHLVSLPYSFFQTRSTGDLLMRVSSNATVREILTSNTLSGLLDGSFVLLYAVLIFFISPVLGLIVVTLAGLHALLFFASRRRYRQLLVEDLEAQAKAQGYLVQLLGGIETLKCAGAEHQALGKWSNLYVGQLNVSLRRGALSAVVDALRKTLESLAPMIILSYGALAVIGGDLSLGTMLAVSALATGVFGPISSLVASALQLQLLGGYMERIEDVMDTAPEQDESRVVPAPPLDGNIAVRDLSFSYSDKGPPAVDGVSLDIPAGASVAIVGPSGSGKSTLANLLAGLYQPSSGAVYYDGRRLDELDVRSVRRQIGVVPQSPFVFGGTVRENIAITSPEEDLTRIAGAARIACLDREIMAMPMGYDTVLADGGASLSGGQRQRIAIARSVLRNPRVMVLDEATSALDSVTEMRVMNQLNALGATRIMIAHRLTTIINADLIVVMDQGRVVEWGTHRDLIARRGLYSALVGARLSGAERPPLEVAS